MASRYATAQPSSAWLVRWRMFAFPALATLCLFVDFIGISLGSISASLIFAIVILIAGIPHGSLDIEILARHLGRSDALAKIKLTIGYAGCAGLMSLIWFYAPPLALASFLLISILHFGLDWRGSAEPFFGMAAGWAIIALPALSHPTAVTAIFTVLVGDRSGATVSALLACSAVPASLITLAFCRDAFTRGNQNAAIQVATCLLAAIFLPPLASFALFFCVLHSPRHLADALAQSGPMSALKKGAIMVAVVCLSLGIAVWIFTHGQPLAMNEGTVRATFILLSILTLPHFILEQFLSRKLPAPCFGSPSPF